ncbi:hypothetical protein [Streptomyces sp. NRRL S-495]|uniref:hypothetical protein n=1 Tax=Streptomyces sp. NRRL S-495 TaxID=1609133 RepID=UPI002570AC2F|nr:hypothetical protein [Streptomyces sp. NRRL S-495]
MRSRPGEQHLDAYGHRVGACGHRIEPDRDRSGDGHRHGDGHRSGDGDPRRDGRGPEVRRRTG